MNEENEYRLVPVEPTAEMSEAGCQGYMNADGSAWVLHPSSMGHAYAAMLAAAPVPPAGDVEVLGWNCNGHHFSSQAHAESYQRWMEEPTPITFLVDRAHVTRLTAELALERTRADVAVADCNDAEAAGKKVSKLLADRTVERDDLKVEVERLEDDLDNAANWDTAQLKVIQGLQSDLTKARELLTQGAYFGPGVWSKRVLEFLAHQPAPAAKGEA